MIEQNEAIAAAETWLVLLDSGQYQSCWESASSLMRTGVAEDQLAQSLHSVLAPLGSALSRSLDTAGYHETLPGAPDGRYWVLKFSTSYTNKQAGTETITLMLDHEEWRVSGSLYPIVAEDRTSCLPKIS